MRIIDNPQTVHLNAREVQDILRAHVLAETGRKCGHVVLAQAALSFLDIPTPQFEATAILYPESEKCANT